MNKILSIIIPTYNMESLLRHTLGSLLVSEENMKKLEVLVINDGSKDSSLAIAQEYEQKYPDTFRAIDKPNGNYGSCINTGLELATGKYVKVLDADDSFDTSIFDDYVSYLNEIEVDLVVSDYTMVNADGLSLYEYTFDLPVDRVFLLSEMPKGVVVWLWHHGITYKTEIVRKINYKQTVGISYTDDEWIVKPMILVKTASYYPNSLYLYLRGREGQTYDIKVLRRTFEQRMVVLKSLVEYYEKEKQHFSESARWFIVNKIEDRIHSIYKNYLLKHIVDDYNEKAIELDSYLKKTSLDLYSLMDKVENNYGWHYIRQWRLMGYSKFAPELLIIRLRRNMSSKALPITIEQMPSAYKRK